MPPSRGGISTRCPCRQGHHVRPVEPGLTLSIAARDINAFLASGKKKAQASREGLVAGDARTKERDQNQKARLCG